MLTWDYKIVYKEVGLCPQEVFRPQLKRRTSFKNLDNQTQSHIQQDLFGLKLLYTNKYVQDDYHGFIAQYNRCHMDCGHYSHSTCIKRRVLSPKSYTWSNVQYENMQPIWVGTGIPTQFDNEENKLKKFL